MEKINIGSINLCIERYDRNPIVSNLQREVNKLKIQKGSGQISGELNDVIVTIDGNKEVVNMGKLVKTVNENKADIKVLKETTVGDQIWNEVTL
nr:MAG TPA: hypothetical protein [Bacteriophage sp.]